MWRVGPRPVAHTGWLSGHTSTTPCATAQGVCDTKFTASANIAASITANPATGSEQDMKEPVFVSIFFASAGCAALRLLKIDVAGKYDVQLEPRNLQRHFCGK